MDEGLSPDERVALASALELLPIVGMLAAMENTNPVWIAPLVLISGAGWALIRRYRLAALFLCTRAMLVIVPFVLVGVYTQQRCGDGCTWHQGFGSVWPLWIATLFAQPLLSALALVAQERRSALP